MEHRFSSRSRMGFDVVLYENGIPFGVGIGRDISLLGMYVETPSAQSLRRHQILEVEFAGKTRSAQSRRYRFPAMVVRHESDGIGLIFETSDRLTRDAVRALVAAERGSAGQMAADITPA